jgi:hypothetical protein
MMNFTDALKEAKRRSMLTGQPITNQEELGLSNAFFESAHALAPEKRMQKLREDELAQQRQIASMQMDAAEKSGDKALISNIGQNAVSFVGTDYMKNGDNSLITKGFNAGKELFDFGTQTPATFTEALQPALSEATGTGQGLSIAGELGKIAPDAELAAGGMGAGEIAAEGAAGTITANAATPTVTGVIGKASPYVAAAQIGGTLLEGVSGRHDNNVVSQGARTLQNPFEISNWAEQFNGNKPIQGGWKTAKDVLDPVGWLLGGK